MTQKSSKTVCCIAKADKHDPSQMRYGEILPAFIHDYNNKSIW